MLFLLNDRVVDLDAPEARLNKRWREMGCGEPGTLRAQDAINWACDAVYLARQASVDLSEDHMLDIAALVISKTGANSLILKPTASGRYEPRLQDLPAMVLEAYQRGAANDEAQRLRA